MQKNKFLISFTLILIFIAIYCIPSIAINTDSIYVWSSSSNTKEIPTNSSNTNISNTNIPNTNVSNTNISNTNVSNTNISNTNNSQSTNRLNTNNSNTTNISNTNSVNTSTSNTETENNSLNLESESAILIEQTTGQVLYSHNVHEQLRPASVTKVMSILLIMEALDNGKISLTDNVPCSENAASMGGSQIWLDPRETLTVDEMLKAICVASANDYKVQLRHKKF